MTTGQTNRLAQILTRLHDKEYYGAANSDIAYLLAEIELLREDVERIRGCLTLIKNVAQQSIDGTLDTAEWRKSFIDTRTKND